MSNKGHNEFVTREEFQDFRDGLMREGSQKIQELRQEQQADMKAIRALLEPISETYRAASLMGKWAMAGIVALSIILGIAFSIKDQFK